MGGRTLEHLRRHVHPCGGTVGNDRPIVTTAEVWSYIELGITALRKGDDPRYGVSTTRLVHLTRGDPDPKLFGVPQGFKITDVNGPAVQLHYPPLQN